MNKIAVIVATKDRPGELRTMLKSLSVQSHLPEQVVIVDSGAEPDDVVAKEFPALPITYIRYTGKPSAWLSLFLLKKDERSQSSEG